MAKRRKAAAEQSINRIQGVLFSEAEMDAMTTKRPLLVCTAAAEVIVDAPAEISDSQVLAWALADCSHDGGYTGPDAVFNFLTMKPPNVRRATSRAG